MNHLIKLRVLKPSQLIYSTNRSYSNPKKGFLQNMIDNFKKEYESDKEIKANIEKFRKSTKELEQSDEFIKIRQLYRKLEQEIPTDTGEKVMSTIRTILERFHKETDQSGKREILRKGLESLGRMGETVRDSELAKQAARGIQALDDGLRPERSRMYCAPATLKTRYELAGKVEHRKVIEANEEAMGVVLHKDSKWWSTWNNFKENNAYMQKIFDLKTQLDESDSLTARSTRFMADKIGGIFSTFVSKNEMESVLEEIVKMDSSFTVDSFIHYCQFEVIPNVLEAMVRGDTVILKDWCHEAAYNVISAPITELQKLGCRFNSLVLDVHHVDVISGSIMEQGPVLIISFESQQIECVRDASGGAVVRGSPDKCIRVRHHWALCRDQSELNPWAAWRLIDIAMVSNEQWF